MNTKKQKEIPAFDCLAVTNVQVFPFKEGPMMGHMKALATIVLNDQIQIRGLRVMEGENGLYVGYPADPYNRGEDFFVSKKYHFSLVFVLTRLNILCILCT